VFQRSEKYEGPKSDWLLPLIGQGGALRENFKAIKGNKVREISSEQKERA
jgi:hypothetical protein